jgi:peptidoglycan/LPS O-acetylase OafA/YrhL
MSKPNDTTQLNIKLTEHSRNNLDLMRLAFASLVLLAHSFELIDGNSNREPLTRIFGTVSFGSFSVDCFFVLSGFLIIQSWDRSSSAVSYYRKRILRIYPAFIICSLISIFIVGRLGAVDPETYYSSISISRSVLDVLRLAAPVGAPAFADSYHPDINGAVWTISYEFYCYIGLSLIGLAGLSRKLWIAAGFAFALLLYMLLRQHDLAQIFTSVPNTRTGTIIRFGMLFLGGAFAAKFQIHHIRSGLLALVCSALWVVGSFSPLLAEPALAVFGTYVLLYVGYSPLDHPGVRAIPDVSYGAYLYGWPVQKLVIFYFPILGPIPVFVLSLIVALLCGTVSWFAIEKPALRLARVG